MKTVITETLKCLSGDSLQMLAVCSDYKYATVYVNFTQSVAYYSHTTVVLQSRYVNFILMLTIFKIMARLGYM